VSKAALSKPAKGSKVSTRAPSQRMLRVAELIRHKLAEMLSRGEIHDDVIAAAVITVPEVRLSPDLKLATVYIMPLGGKDLAPVLAALERNKAYLRREIAHTLTLKYAPDLRFRKDESFEEADRIERLLASPKVRQDTAQDAAQDTVKTETSRDDA
jgi:ribosome-binding factor A